MSKFQDGGLTSFHTAKCSATTLVSENETSAARIRSKPVTSWSVVHSYVFFLKFWFSVSSTMHYSLLKWSLYYSAAYLNSGAYYVSCVLWDPYSAGSRLWQCEAAKYRCRGAVCRVYWVQALRWRCNNNSDRSIWLDARLRQPSCCSLCGAVTPQMSTQHRSPRGNLTWNRAKSSLKR